MCFPYCIAFPTVQHKVQIKPVKLRRGDYITTTTFPLHIQTYLQQALRKADTNCAFFVVVTPILKVCARVVYADTHKETQRRVSVWKENKTSVRQTVGKRCQFVRKRNREVRTPEQLWRNFALSLTHKQRANTTKKQGKTIHRKLKSAFVLSPLFVVVITGALVLQFQSQYGKRVCVCARVCE